MTNQATSAGRSSGPSVYKLVSTFSKERSLLQPADALVIIGRQLELVVQDEGLAADLTIGTLRFSLFRLHQGRVGQLTPFCRSLTVYGDADVEAPEMAGVEFVPLQPGTPLSLEWFLLIDSPGFWGALLTQAVPDRTNGNMRRYLFEGALTADERVVSRANLLLSLMRRRPVNDVGQRNLLANRARWGRVVYGLVNHSEAQRLNLVSCLGEFPDLVALASRRDNPIEQLLPQTINLLHEQSGAAGALLYRLDGGHLVPTAWSGPQPPTLDSGTRNIAAQAIQANTPLLLPLGPADAEQQLLPMAHSVAAIPVRIAGRPWGVLLAGQPEADPTESQVALSAAGITSVLEQILAEKGASSQAALTEILPTDLFAPQSAPPAYTPPTSSAAPAYAPPAAPAPSISSFFPSTELPAAAPTYTPPAAPAPAYTPPAAPAPAYTPPAASATPAMPEPAAPTSTFGLPAWMRGGNPVAPPSAPIASPIAQPTAPVQMDNSWPMLQKRLMGALVAFDQRGAEQIWSEACSLYSAESICVEMLIPVQVAIGEGWHRGEVSVAAEHFSSRFVQGKLINMLNVHPDNGSGPLAVIGCAQGELHEIGVIILSLFMRWSGFRVVYLGQNVPNSTIEETVRRLRPQVLGLSATTIEGAHNLTETGQLLSRMEPPRPLFIFGGMAFYERPELRARIHGQFLEGDIRKIVRDLAEQFRK